MMRIIVSVDLNWGIGSEGELLKRIPEDMKRFRRKTIKNVIVMGRRTFESLPNQAPLKSRVNIILSRDEEYKDDRLVICNSIQETIEKLKEYEDKDIYIIGGEAIYTAFLPFCDEALITKFNHEYEANKFFPNLDLDENWEITEIGEDKEYEGTQYKYVTYKNMKVRSEINE